MVCDASTIGLGVALQQFAQEGWVAVAYASRFLNSLEESCYVNELGVLGSYGRVTISNFTCMGENSPSLPTIKAHLVHETRVKDHNSQGRLTKKIDRLISFKFYVKHSAGSKAGLKNYMSGNPVGLAKHQHQMMRNL